ncbi:hypothetical protein A6P39_038100 [Streptomyces sp. FXJ1.172]|nr:hypothetical protein [Streptomyces sp. FXJ1.172]WEO99388.1 hypothetical protein A6P39_038100 [Streptomyces sp. FXJ1.172]
MPIMTLAAVRLQAFVTVARQGVMALLVPHPDDPRISPHGGGQ